jgi:hypothetical protein
MIEKKLKNSSNHPNETQTKKFSKKFKESSRYTSDSQPGCHKEVSGVPPNLELLPFY